jgi:hypothetical protein
MTRPKPIRREDGLCLCNCGLPALPDLAFSSESCRKRYHRREYKKHGVQLRYRNREVFGAQRGALVYYKECADPDRMSKTAAEHSLKAGQFMPGDIICMDGKRIEITERAISDELAKQQEMAL